MSRSKHARGYTHHDYCRLTKPYCKLLRRKLRARMRERISQERWDDLTIPEREVDRWWYEA